MSSSANKTTPMPLTYQPLPLAQVQVALLLMASQSLIIMVTQSLAQVMSTAMAASVLSCLPKMT
jgi:hypothetical protein